MKTSLLLAGVVSMLGLTMSLYAADAAGAKDHPILKRVEGSEIIWNKVAKFDEYKIPLEKIEWDYNESKFKDSKKENVEGARTILYYKLPGETSTLEAVRQYEEDLKEAGFERQFTAANDDLDNGYNRFVSETFPSALNTQGLKYLHEFNHKEQRFLVLKGKGKSGNDVYVTIYAFALEDVSTGFAELKEAHQLEKGQTIARVDVLETKAMEARMKVVKAEEITQGIEKTGRIAIYGVYFDTDKADIKPESDEALAEIAKAIQGGKGKYLIVGHTDNVGDYAHNQGLSQRRAVSVSAALTSKFNIPAEKIIPIGVGMAAPVAPNTDEAGRAKNRRVEIVAM